MANTSNAAAALDLLRRERFDDALSLLDRNTKAAAAPDPDALLLEASLLVQANRLAAAAEVCHRLLELDELNAGANYVLALCFEGNGDSTSALLHYDLAIHLDPNFAMPLMRRGMLARRRGEADAARADLQRALELLQLEDASRLLLFGGGFTRAALSTLCQAELHATGDAP
jgi:chemotaxis protein methyltransferase CheR